MNRNQLLLICLLLISSFAFAQGDTYFRNRQYLVAVSAYSQEVNSKPEKYLNLAKAHFALKQFPEAIAAMENYKSKYKKADLAYANWFIEVLKRNDSEVPVIPVTGAINTSGTESVPRISGDGKRLYFKSEDRSGGTGGEDIWYSDKNEDGTWSQPQQFNDLNTDTHETMYAMSADGKIVILFGNYPGTYGGGDIFYSVKTIDGWSAPCNIGGTINTAKWEAQAALSPDGKTLVYVTDSKIKGSNGGKDLYLSNLTDNGWTKPMNLGTKINTKGNEIRPAFATDGKTLYFSSDGHKSFGGTDIFVTRKLDDTWNNWSEPVNLGKYINTLQDDEDISVNPAGTVGYTVKYNETGAPGDYDIFQFIMPEIARPEQTITLWGYVKNEKDSAAAVNLRFTNLTTKTLQVVVPSFEGNGMYSVNLPFDKYLVEINMKGFLYQAEEFDFTDPSKFYPKKNIREKIGADAQLEIEQLTAEIDKYNAQLKELNASKSLDIKGSFENYNDLTDKYNQAVLALKKKIGERRYAWISEEKKFEDVQHDFKVQRATAGITFKLENIFFDLGKATLKPESKPSLDELFKILDKNDIYIELGGHTDSIGSNESNQLLSQERVNSVKNYLLDKGVKPDRITAVGYGETKPVVSNSTEEGRAKNRRVEVKIVDNTPVAREGVEKELVEKKATKKSKDHIVEPTVAKQDFNMLATLQNAAKIGGLPEGSPCGENKTYTLSKVSNVKSKKKGRLSNLGGSTFGGGSNFKLPNYNYSGSSAIFSFDEFATDDYIYKPFNIGIENFGNVNNSNIWAINLKMVNRNRLEDHGSVAENTFQYFPKNDLLKYGLGYQFLKFNSLKELISLPIGFIWGIETKMLNQFDYLNNVVDGIEQPEPSTHWDSYLGIPIGLRALININDLVLSPDVYYHYALLSTQTEKNLGLKSNYLGFGANARWKAFTGGLHLNLGESIGYLGLSAGFSF
jgi:outer membrane protein OmpA-like peptidoglycan-associated protein